MYIYIYYVNEMIPISSVLQNTHMYICITVLNAIILCLCFEANVNKLFYVIHSISQLSTIYMKNRSLLS